MSRGAGRLAPSPTGFLHAGHARTFHIAWSRARAAGDRCILRHDDLDTERRRPEYADAAVEDLRWLGLDWDEGPDVGGPHAPYAQSQRTPLYLAAWRQLLDAGFLFPCARSRRDVRAAAAAPHEGMDEPVYPPAFRPPAGSVHRADAPGGVHWRFRVPDGRRVAFVDGRAGPCAFTAGVDFGDFVVWRADGVPAYQLATVVDDHAMGVTEVVRGEDLLLSTARQILLFEALGWACPAWWHAPLVRDADGRRLAKRSAALAIRALRAAGRSPAEVLALAGEPAPGQSNA